MSEALDKNHIAPGVLANWPKLLEDLRLHLRLQEPLSDEFIKETYKLIEIFDKKQSDYGPTNIAKFGDYGVLVRMSDKIERIANMYKKNKRKGRVNESIEDNLRDIANYAIITLLWRNGKWPR